mmetsp:Transcript_35423/g.87104  ORF Transcript_35423/g.87104 Transcript_35423/m.87104 type:complete len:268 (+) Transcript_35423:1-804(+)
MPLARMMARSEAVQEHASGNPGLQAFLDKKSDEHLYSFLYLLAGVVCLYAAFWNGDNFCTHAPPPGVKEGAHPQELVYMVKLVENSTDVPAGGNGTGVQGDVGKLLGDLEKDHFTGPAGLVVTWLKVEGLTALGLPMLSALMLMVGLRDHIAVGCVLFLVAVFQAGWLAVGCFWAFGRYVPDACVHGEMGNNFAYKTMWWVCAVWLGVMVLISGFMLCVVCCIMAMATTTLTKRADESKEGYQPVAGGIAQGDPKNRDPTDPANRYV